METDASPNAKTQQEANAEADEASSYPRPITGPARPIVVVFKILPWNGLLGSDRQNAQSQGAWRTAWRWSTAR